MTNLPRHACIAAVVFASLGCDRLGIGKGDADGGNGGGGGGLLSFLDKSFEGDIAMAASSPGKPAKHFTLELRPPKIRVEAGADLAEPGNPILAQGLSLILDTPARKAYALIHAKKQAIVIDFDKAKTLRLPGPGGGPSAPSAPSAPPEKPNIEKTGKKDVVAGYSCEIWKVTNKDGSHAEACLAEGIKWMDLSDFGLRAPEIASAAALSDLNHFPLRMVSFDAKNAETSRLEATKIDKKKLDETRFVVPSDYQVVDLAQMMGALGGAPGAGAGGSARPLPPGFPRPH